MGAGPCPLAPRPNDEHNYAVGIKVIEGGEEKFAPLMTYDSSKSVETSFEDYYKSFSSHEGLPEPFIVGKATGRGWDDASCLLLRGIMGRVKERIVGKN